MSVSRTIHSLTCLVMGLTAPLCLTQCKTGAGTYKDVEYDPAMLKTPSGHGLEKKDYPFDDNGAYRKDWVKNKSTGRTRSSQNLPVAPAVEEVADSGSSPPAPYPTYAEAAQSRNAEVTGTIQNIDNPGATTSIAVPPSTSATAITSSPASYHKVETGDTLFALSQRYRTTVDELKRVNGLADNSIQSGQTLRLP